MGLLAVYNSSGFTQIIQRELDNFQRLYRAKAMLHHYTQFVEVKNARTR